MSYTLTPAVRIEIEDDYPLVRAFFDWLLSAEGEAVNKRCLRGWTSGQGRFSGDFLAEDAEILRAALEQLSANLVYRELSDSEEAAEEDTWD